MSNYETLLAETAVEREAFLAIPVLRRALESGVDRALYRAYLEQAYHHVRHTCPLLALAIAHCGPAEARLRDAFLDYIDEERGHDEWILADIAALGGDAEAVRAAEGDAAVRVMIAYATYAIERIGPHALLGMVHVLEGVSAAIATQAATAIRGRIGGKAGGFSYLESHGSLDQEHVKFFAALMDDIDDAKARHAVTDTARIMYRLFGDMFRDLDKQAEGGSNAA